MKRIVAAGVLGCASFAMAGRPLVTNDAEPLEEQKFQLEAGVAYVKEDSCKHFDAPLALTYGVMPAVEAGIGFGGQFEQRHAESGDTSYEEGLSDLTLGFKWKVLEQDKAFFDQAISGAVKLPSADEDEDLGSGNVDYDLTYIMTRQLGDHTTALLNVGYTWLGGDSDVFHYSTALVYQLTDTLQPVGELLFETPVDGGKTSVGLSGGLRYQLLESLMLDAAVGTRLAGDWPDCTATVGFTWVF